MADTEGRDEAGAQTPTSFLSLPAELRNEIYKLSGCLRVLQCSKCLGSVRGDDDDDDDDTSYCKCSPRREPCEPCVYLPKAYIWINRRSGDRQLGGVRVPMGGPHVLDSESIVGISQPALTRVSKQVRADTLPMFYAGDQRLRVHSDQASGGSG
ncbi:hypothetical protein M409DRAFT_26786 [Zasmidium cellare ATCC 36951]|uniref:Uncharacterized protein n=1 Tax=Zasmidium cellare ATCC 36951 TaxID=1080233 RepID=A0A6A6C7V5_ZASCE|nr:uncharacterized protein M409DRAFT_26786 [Zasmidium cellare ATCC 36951]KAF2162933.1 hypothetical protein M409DRAFT_26786 [Zasmidium cellare ATCC 36951]